jgi:AraC-like DNA-binding protein
MGLPDRLVCLDIPVSIEPFCWKGLGPIEPRAATNYLSLYWVRSGSVHLQSGLDSRHIRRGDLVSIRTQVLQNRVVETVQGSHLIAELGFLQNSYTDPLFAPLQQFLQQLTEPILHIRFSAQARSEADWLLNRMVCEDRTHSEIFLASIRLNLEQFLLLCYRQWRFSHYQTERISPDAEHVIRVLCDYIEQHVTEQFGLKQLARRAGYAPSYLSSLFNRATGQGLAQYISRKRIALAQELLHSTNMKVVEICYDVGFRDLAHFNRTFKKVVGVTPNQYRELSHAFHEDSFSHFPSQSYPVFEALPREL